jgi:hypothetical protein
MSTLIAAAGMMGDGRFCSSLTETFSTPWTYNEVQQGILLLQAVSFTQKLSWHILDSYQIVDTCG